MHEHHASTTFGVAPSFLFSLTHHLPFLSPFPLGDRLNGASGAKNGKIAGGNSMMLARNESYPRDILARPRRLVVRARGVIVVFTCIITPLAASAQIVEPDVKRWSEEQCIWLHRTLDECKSGPVTDPQQECSGKLREVEGGSMSTTRGFYALDRA